MDLQLIELVVSTFSLLRSSPVTPARALMLSDPARLIFWLSLTLILYVYAGYPLLLVSGLLSRRKPIRRGATLPSLSVLIPAHNEEKTIAGRIENLLSSDYPPHLFQILVGDDASTDRTAAIVDSLADENVQLISAFVRRGKSAIQNELVARASGSILVFTDADCFLQSHALRLLVENFTDPAVGLATNRPSFSNPRETRVVEAENLYWRYEHWLRQQESDRGLLAMASGSLFALRREHWQPLDPNVSDDFVLPLRVSLQGCRNVLDSRVSALTKLTQKHAPAMLHMKMRIISKDFRGLLHNLTAANPFCTGPVAVALWSHKLLRWLVPYFLLALAVSNLFLNSHAPYAAFFIAQALFYALALAGALDRGRHLKFPFSVASSFCLVNCAALLGTLHCLAGRTAGQWRTIR